MAWYLRGCLHHPTRAQANPETLETERLQRDPVDSLRAACKAVSILRGAVWSGRPSVVMEVTR